MANEITFGHYTGKTLTYGAYQPDGTVRTAAGTSLPEIAGTGYYVASNANIVAGDFVIVKEGTLEVGQGQYQPEVTAPAVVVDIAAVQAGIDSLISSEGKVNNVVEQKETDLSERKARIYL